MHRLYLLLLQLNKLNSFTWGYTLTKDKTSNNYTDSEYALWVAYEFEMLWKQLDFLISGGNTVLSILFFNVFLIGG